MLLAVSLTLAVPPQDGRVGIAPTDTAARAGIAPLVLVFPPDNGGVKLIFFARRVGRNNE